ncbi:DUF2300 domain-containing protein [Massilia forsythiae]|uniref:DUF2300 domain-containing protein n=2 Tax=Massilia forsythiae TaxID=2728020 RepID=A0A7Z2W2Z1_9BURK|nr:DUF2300 domain-containing protein [Massilia forsythiae]
MRSGPLRAPPRRPWRPRARALAAACLLAAACAQPAAATLDLAWLRGGEVAALQLHQGARPPSASVHASAPAAAGARPVPLGSLWKLFVYVYAADSGLPMPDYRCGGHVPDEVYCCEAGASIDRDAALAQSCGLFFSPARLMLARDPWRRYWTRRLGAAPAGQFAWLADPALLTPERTVRLDSLLRALASLPPASRADAEAALLRVVLDGRGADTVRWFGSRLRVKTFSWHEPGHPRAPLGGAAGWLADGTPVWFAGAGTSAAILRGWAPQLAAALPPPVAAADAAGAAPADAGCVVVDFFARYPLRSVTGPAGPARPGPLAGRHVALFENGQRLAFRADGMTLARGPGGHPLLQGRFGVNDYVARVLEREGGAAEPEAAKALAIAARSYLRQNARPEGSCRRIADSSAAQRVGPDLPSPAALAVARWTDRLVVDGPAVRYHGTTPGPNVLAWSDALAQARAGRPFDAILARAYPGAVLTVDGAGGRSCRRLHGNEDWLAAMLPRWERLLRSQPGYERPAQLPSVCELALGAPYSEQSRNRIFMRPLSGREDRITLAHEYVHIALRGHPRGQDEAYVEQTARRLVDLNLESL